MIVMVVCARVVIVIVVCECMCGGSDDGGV